MSGRRLFIRTHLGLGDQLICTGMIRTLAAECSSLVLPVKDIYSVTVSHLFADLPQIKILPIDPRAEIREVAYWTELLADQNYEKLLIGRFGSDFMKDGIGFAESFYRQAGLDPELRWTAFDYPRREDSEDELMNLVFREMDLKPGHPYAFLHDDETRKYLINPEKLPFGVVCIKPELRWTSNLLLYRKLIENAEGLHLIDSSFAIFADLLPLNKGQHKTIHRYARSEQATNPTHYKLNWKLRA